MLLKGIYGIVIVVWVYVGYLWAKYKTPEAVKAHLQKKFPDPRYWKTLYYGYCVIAAIGAIVLLLAFYEGWRSEQ